MALDDHYQDKLTFPPFTHNRIVSERYFARISESMYEEQCPPHLVHRRYARWRENKLHRRVSDFSMSGLFVWYSSGSERNERASLMVYQSGANSLRAWYAVFARRGGWLLEHVKGINRGELAALLGT